MLQRGLDGLLGEWGRIRHRSLSRELGIPRWGVVGTVVLVNLDARRAEGGDRRGCTCVYMQPRHAICK